MDKIQDKFFAYFAFLFSTILIFLLCNVFEINIFNFSTDLILCGIPFLLEVCRKENPFLDA